MVQDRSRRRRKAPRGIARVLPAALLAVAALSAGGDAEAFCRATTCRGQDSCDGEEIPGCTPLIWKRNCIGFALQESGSIEVDLDRTRQTMNEAFAAWQSADCGAGPPGIAIQDMGDVTCDRVEFNTTAGNVNLVVFRDDEWPHADGQHNLALTTVSFDPDSGELYNADIEVNTAGYDFVDGGDYDFLSVMTHEAGHFLGLGHTTVAESTMLPTYTPGSTEFQTLGEDDVFGICSVYPTTELDPGRCNPIPRHGFASLCGAEQPSGSCALSGVGAAGSAGATALLGAAAGLAALRRRRAVTGRSGRRRG